MTMHAIKLLLKLWW